MTRFIKLALRLLVNVSLLNICWCCAKECGSKPVLTPVTDPVLHGEGPHWDVETQHLFFVDIEGEKVNRYDPISGLTTHANLIGGGVSLIIPIEGTSTKELLVTRGHDILIFKWNFENAVYENTTKSEHIELITSVETTRNFTIGNRWNDGKADAKGRLWAGTIGPEPVVGHVLPDRGALYLLDPNATETITEVKPISISNGIAYNADNTLMYYIDTGTLQVDVFDFDLERGRISNRRKVFNLPEHNVPGFPDGMTIDNNGNLWVACFGGSRVINVNPRTGELIREVHFPVERITSVIFGGQDLDTLYVTTSRLGLTPEQSKAQPLAGSTFAVTCLGVRALAPGHNVVRDKNVS